MPGKLTHWFQNGLGFFLKALLIILLFINLIQALGTDEGPPLVYEGKTIQERQVELGRFLEKMEKKAKENPAYNPDNYFQDLIARYKKEKELKISSSSFVHTHNLQEYSARPFANQEEHWSAIEASKRKYLSTVQEYSRASGLEELSWSEALKQLVSFYFSCLPLAFLYLCLLVIGGLIDGEEEKYSFLNLPTLILCSIVYPLTFLILLIDFFKQGVIIIEYSRTRKYLLMPFSGSELKEVRELAQSISWKEVFAYFPSQGLAYRHSFAAACLAVVVLVLVPENAWAGIENLLSSAPYGQEQLHLPRSDIVEANQEKSWSSDKDGGSGQFGACWCLFPVFVFCFFLLKLEKVVEKIFSPPRGFKEKIEVVPLSFLVFLRFVLIFNLKNMEEENEKNFDFSGYDNDSIIFSFNPAGCSSGRLC